MDADTHIVHTEGTLAQEAFPEASVQTAESSSQILMASPATSPAGDTTQQEAVQLACLALTKPGDAGAAASAAVLGAASLAFKRTSDTLKLGSVTIQRVYPAFDGADIINGDTMLHAAVRRQLHDVTSALLEAGAPLGVRNTNGETAFEIVTVRATPPEDPDLERALAESRRQADEDEAQLAAALAASALESTPRNEGKAPDADDEAQQRTHMSGLLYSNHFKLKQVYAPGQDPLARGWTRGGEIYLWVAKGVKTEAEIHWPPVAQVRREQEAWTAAQPWIDALHAREYSTIADLGTGMEMLDRLDLHHHRQHEPRRRAVLGAAVAQLVAQRQLLILEHAVGQRVAGSGAVQLERKGGRLPVRVVPAPVPPPRTPPPRPQRERAARYQQTVAGLDDRQ